MKTLVIIPAYNEEESILRVVRNLENADIDCDYIVINDCSKDSTGKILDDNNINHVDLPVNLGLTGAVQTGYKYAYYNNYDAAIQFDGDGQHLPEYIPSLVKEIENGYDIVIGSRFVDEKKHFSMRMLGSRIITAMIKLTTFEILCIVNLISLSPAQYSSLFFISYTHSPKWSLFAFKRAGIYDASLPSCVYFLFFSTKLTNKFFICFILFFK